MNLPFRYMSRLLSITLAERRDYTDSSRKNCGNYWSQYLLCHINIPFRIKFPAITLSTEIQEYGYGYGLKLTF